MAISPRIFGHKPRRPTDSYDPQAACAGFLGRSVRRGAAGEHVSVHISNPYIRYKLTRDFPSSVIIADVIIRQTARESGPVIHHRWVPLCQVCENNIRVLSVDYQQCDECHMTAEETQCALETRSLSGKLGHI